jgi:predicted esterase
MTGWFDLYDWPIDRAAPEDRATVQQSAALLHNEIQALQQEYHLSPRQIVIGGFSQGGAIALVTAYHEEYGWGSTAAEDRLGGCVNLSGWWPLARTTDGASAGTPSTEVPLFWGHGRYDDKVLFEHQAVGVQYLQEQRGVQQIQAQQYPIGHSSDPNELRDMADFVDRIVFGGVEQQQQQELTTPATTTMDKEL